MKKSTVTFFGNFGTQNLGNEYTLKAMLENLRERFPDARFNCVCPDPDDASSRYGIPAIPISYRYSPSFRSAGAGRGRALRLLRRLFVRAPLELVEWWKAFRALEGTRMLVMTGTGMLCDFGIEPLELHYEILKWSLLAKLRGAKLLFVSVGAGPLADRWSQWLVKRAVSLADYRSYRDAFSKEYLARIGFDSGSDPVYPDLAFSLGPTARPGSGRSGSGRIAGVGLMDYYGSRHTSERGEQAYRGYLEKVTDFVEWLLDRDYTVLLLVGDLAYDIRARRDLMRRLSERNPDRRTGSIVEVPISSVEELLGQLAQTDVVVATRFHNVLLALMLDKPVLALSYHEKVAALMSGLGLGDYCHDVDRFSVDRLVEQFADLERNAATVRSVIARKKEEYRRALDEQYAMMSSL